MATIWVILGMSGEYSDHREWLVCAYSDKEKAKKHADMAHDFARWVIAEDERRRDEDTSYWSDLYPCREGEVIHPPEFRNPYDAEMKIVYDRVDYVALPVEVRDELPEVG